MRVEERIRFAAESRVVALARLGDIARTLPEMRVNLRSALLATDPAALANAGKLYEADRVELERLLTDYADHHVWGGPTRDLPERPGRRSCPGSRFQPTC